jgi:hypothetical protein
MERPGREGPLAGLNSDRLLEAPARIKIERCTSTFWLNVASADTTDPVRDLTLYNLQQQLANQGRHDEAEAIVDGLLSSHRSHYRRAWYLLRIKGFLFWSRALESASAGNPEASRAAFAASASFYARAIWHRPKIEYRRAKLYRPPRARRIPIPPKMYGNTFDAYRAAGRPIRARFFLWREKRARARVMRMAEKALQEERFEDADRRFVWAIVGRNDDWDMHSYIGRFAAHIGMSREDREAGRDAGADEHDKRAAEYLARAMAMDPEHAREILEQMTGEDLSLINSDEDTNRIGTTDDNAGM